MKIYEVVGYTRHVQGTARISLKFTKTRKKAKKAIQKLKSDPYWYTDWDRIVIKKKTVN